MAIFDKKQSSPIPVKDEDKKIRVASGWSNLSPGMRAGITFMGIFAVAAIPGYLFTSNEPTSKPIVKTEVSPTETNLVVPTRKDVTINSIEGLGNRISRQDVALQEMTQALSAIQKNQITLMEQKGTQPFMAQEMASELKAMKIELDQMKIASPVSSKPPALSDPVVPKTPVPETPAPLETPPAPKLRIVGEKASKAAPVELTQQDSDALMAGAIMEGVLINGMDAPTSSVTQRNPVPVLIRVKTDAILPNLYQAGVRECFVIASGFGVLATERAQLRAETLSCVREDGQRLEVRLDAYLIGEDGKVGLRGRLVSKQGQVIAKALTAGVIDGIGKASVASSNPGIAWNPSGGISANAPDSVGDAARSGVAGGMSQAASQISKFYLDMAQQMFPVIEIDAGRRISMVVLRGVSLSDSSMRLK